MHKGNDSNQILVLVPPIYGVVVEEPSAHHWTALLEQQSTAYVYS